MPEKLKEYLETVGEQIRWSRARPVLTAELQTHLLEQAEACLAQGMAEEDAEAEALRQMGDPVELGRELDSVHRPAPQWGLLVLVSVLALAGGFLRVWLTANAGIPYVAVSPAKTVIFVALGFAALLGGYFLDYTLLGRYARQIYVAAILAGLLSLRFSPLYNNASYYTRYVVLAYPLVYALWVYSLRGKGWKGVLMSVLGGVPLACIAYVAPYLLGALVLVISGAIMLVMAVWKGWFGQNGRTAAVIIGGITALCAAVIVWWLRYLYYSPRLYFVFSPEQDPFGYGYQALTTRAALDGARWWGRGSMTGMWAGQDYWRVVPEGEGDCLLTTLIHTLGWLPFLLLVGALCVLLLWAMVKMLRQKNLLGQLVSAAVILTLGLQLLTSVMLNLGFVLFSASCPLVVGNLHALLDMALLGVMLSVFRQERIPAADAVIPENRKPKGRWRLVYEIVET